MHAMKTFLFPPSGHVKYLIRCALLCCIPVLVCLVQAFQLSLSFHKPGSSDFDVFFMVSHAFWNGTASEAYRGTLVSNSGEVYNGLRWTYPPPYMLLVAPFAFIPEWAAYLTFMSLSVAAYIAMIRSLSGHYFEVALKMSIPAICVSIAAGQNGLLFGSTVAWLLGCMSSSAGWSGLGLALLALKPQLLPIVLLYFIREKKWRAITIGVLGLLFLACSSVAVQGCQVWLDFLSTMDETRQLLLTGNLRIFRMISVYASLGPLGIAPSYSILAQSLVALGIIYIVIIRSRQASLRGQLGLVALATPLISPYVYDYDMPVAMISFSLLWPLFQEHSHRIERLAYIVCLLFVSVWGLLAETLLPALSRLPEAPSLFSIPTPAGFLLLLSFACASRVVFRAGSQ